MDVLVEKENPAETLSNSVVSEKKSLYERLHSSVAWAKIFRWEFWPFSIVYLPVSFYWVWLVIRTRSFFFFTSSNPGIEFGGMLGESKDTIFDKIPDKYIPVTYKLPSNASFDEFNVRMSEAGLKYPVILKPDIGERGWMVELIKSDQALKKYLTRIKVDYLVQEYVSFPLELGVFYYRYPDRQKGTISSIVVKNMLNVTGRENKTVLELMSDNVRAKMHVHEIQKTEPELLDYVPTTGEVIELVSIGNHSRGTTFLNGNNLITGKLIRVFDEMSAQIDGFYFGRYDLRCRSIEDLYEGKNFKILELNGAGSEPAHIYHPGFSLIQAYKDILHHLKVLADISIVNKQKGTPYMKFLDGINEVRRIRKYNKQKVRAK